MALIFVILFAVLTFTHHLAISCPLPTLPYSSATGGNCRCEELESKVFQSARILD